MIARALLLAAILLLLGTFVAVGRELLRRGGLPREARPIVWIGLAVLMITLALPGIVAWAVARGLLD